jgi:hypothetical protein
MNLTTENGAMTVTLDEDERPEAHLIQHAIGIATARGVWNVYLILSPMMANTAGSTLLGLGFHMAGSVDGKLKLVKALRTSGEAGCRILATDTPTLGPTDFERGAIAANNAEMSKRFK